MDLWTYERAQREAGYAVLCGCDEAGAGPLAGPVYAAAVILPYEAYIPGLNDSKKLTERQREALFDRITAISLSWSVARVEASEIDETDILSARLHAIQLAIDGLDAERGGEDRSDAVETFPDGTAVSLDHPPDSPDGAAVLRGGARMRPDLALIDGNRDRGKAFSITTPHVTLVGGDGKSASIAAASILAKVSRDRYVVRVLDRAYPQYQFAKHKGYGTKLHYAMLDRYGPCPAHRKSFLKKWEKRRTGEPA